MRRPSMYDGLRKAGFKYISEGSVQQVRPLRSCDSALTLLQRATRLIKG